PGPRPPYRLAAGARDAGQRHHPGQPSPPGGRPAGGEPGGPPTAGAGGLGLETLAPPGDRRHRRRAGPAPEGRPGLTLPEERCVLVVDDDPVLRKVVRAVLEA